MPHLYVRLHIITIIFKICPKPIYYGLNAGIDGFLKISRTLPSLIIYAIEKSHMCLIYLRNFEMHSLMLSTIIYLLGR